MMTMGCRPSKCGALPYTAAREAPHAGSTRTAMLVRKSHTGHDSFSVGDLPRGDRMPLSPLERFGSHSPGTQRGGDRSDAVEGHQMPGPHCRGKRGSALCLYRQNGDVGPSEVVKPLQKTAKKPPSPNGDHVAPGFTPACAISWIMDE